MARPLGSICPRRLAAALAALALMALALAAAAPARALADGLGAAAADEVEYSYCDAAGKTWETGSLGPGHYEVVTHDTLELYGGWYVVAGDVAVGSRIDVDGDASLVLCGGAVLDARGGIELQGGDSLTVYAGRVAGGPAGGTLRAQGGGFAAGIGGGSGGFGASGGSVTVYGGTVFAQGGDYAAGIGGASGGSGGQLTVYGGTLRAQGGGFAAGIGGGDGGNGGDVAIYGGAVIGVAGPAGGAGIGGGIEGSGGDVAIYGGAVTGVADGSHAGIGRGASGDSDGGLALGEGVVMYGKGSLDDPWGDPYDPAGGRRPVMSTGGGRTVTATFHANGHGADPQAQAVPYLGRFAPPDPEPTDGEYAFDGWYADEGCAVPFDFGERAMADADVWAKWAKKQKQAIPVPAAAAGLVYSGRPQEGVPAGEGYAVEGGEATDAGSYEATLTADSGHVFEGGSSTATVAWSIARRPIPVPAAATGLVYSGRPQVGVAGEGCVVRGGTATGAGGYTARCEPDKNHVWQDGTVSEVEVAWSIARAANPLRLAKASRTVSASKVGKAKRAVAGAKVKARGQGRVTYARKSVKKKKFKKSFSVDKRTGRITVRKGTPKGTYKVTVKAVAAGNANYEKSARTAVVTIKVR